MFRNIYVRIRNAWASAIGASLVEYLFLVALIAIVCLVAITFLGGETSARYSRFGSEVGSA